MHWLLELIRTPSVAQSAVLLSLVIGVGLALGSVHVRGIGLGIAGVLFAGLVAGDLLRRTGVHVEERMLDFAREGGLVLFVYTIGIQVGPGFVASLRRNGLPLNLMAASVVVLGALLTVAIVWVGLVRVPVAAGLLAGATTNTPSLAAAQQALKDVPGARPVDAALPGMAYAVAYPFGILGILLTMVLTKAIFRIDPRAESDALSAMARRERPEIGTVTLEVTNPNLDDVPLARLPLHEDSGVVVSRIRKRDDGHTRVAHGDTVVHVGDVLLAVGPRPRLDQLRLIVGREINVNLKDAPAEKITARRILVSKPAALGQTVAELNLGQRFGVNVTRVARADLELPPANAPLQFGDTLTVVGEAQAIARVAQELGDSIKQLNHPQIIPLFLGIALGVIVGSWPLHLGLPAPVRLGLAGGPLVVAILLSRLGNVGPLVWYVSPAANFMLRELGIVLFLACVGIRSGGGFLETLTRGGGLWWIGYASAITLVPLMLVALVARAVYKLNYLTLCGMLAGSTTDPPALAFAEQMSGSDAPSVAYVTVYPLVMVLRVLCAQLIVLLLASH
jgi:putative transport protein